MKGMIRVLSAALSLIIGFLFLQTRTTLSQVTHLSTSDLSGLGVFMLCLGMGLLLYHYLLDESEADVVKPELSEKGISERQLKTMLAPKNAQTVRMVYSQGAGAPTPKAEEIPLLVHKGIKEENAFEFGQLYTENLAKFEYIISNVVEFKFSLEESIAALKARKRMSLALLLTLALASLGLYSVAYAHLSGPATGAGRLAMPFSSVALASFTAIFGLFFAFLMGKMSQKMDTYANQLEKISLKINQLQNAFRTQNPSLIQKIVESFEISDQKFILGKIRNSPKAKSKAA